jgi:hypothetical protein
MKHALQHGTRVPTQHSLWDQGKPQLSQLVAGPSGCTLTSDQQSGIKYVIPNTSPCLCCCFIETHLQVVSTNLFYVNTIWTSAKPCVTPAEGMNTNMHTNVHASVAVIP